MSVLRATGLAIGHGRHHLASGLNFTLDAGEIVAVLGPNGCGKTTLLRTLLGLIPALAGEITLFDRALRDWPVAERARRLAWVPQTAANWADFSVQEAVEMARAPHLAWYQQPTDFDRKRAQQALEEVGLGAANGKWSEKRCETLSGGEAQLVMIARALATDAQLLLLDEPTASLDFANQYRVLDRLSVLRERGVTMVFNTHHPEHALRVADRTLLLNAVGQTVFGPSREVITSATLSALYGLNVCVESNAAGSTIRVNTLAWNPHANDPTIL